ncbi:MAG: molybdopterin molybdotransferase MoeA [Candidatus Cloacimonadota bacterium]|nr:MAG: molybdopterin molybdotransferase MoeA [Candidatus Cloacimonadota bacterium]
MKKKFFKVITREKALSLFENIPLKEKERIKTKHSLGRISGCNVVSPCDVPNFDRSTMDGYAVIAEDTFGATEETPISLTLQGEVIMGCETKERMQKGETIAIPTGGMLPQGANAVVMIERTKKTERNILVKKSVAPMGNVVMKGSDIKKGDKLLDVGRRIRAQDIGVLFACGITEIDVFKKPLVSIISTGDELVPSEKEPKLGEIRGINTYTLYTLTEKYGGEPVDFGIVKDSMSKLNESIKEGLSQSDIIVISGGSSVGTKDITLDCISSFDDSKILTNGLALKPGKPTILAMINNKPVLGLPGHPVSCMVIFYLIVRPLIFRMLSYKEGFEDKTIIKAKISQNIPSVSGREEYIRVSLKDKNGEMFAEPVPGGSSIISSLSKSDGLVRIDLESEGIEKGKMVDVIISHF